MEGKKDIMAEGLATVEDVMSFLKVSRQTVYTLMNRGDLPYVRLTRARRVPWLVLKGYAEDRFTGLTDRE